MARTWTEIDRVKIDQGKDYLKHIDEVVELRSKAQDELARIESMSLVGAMRYDRDNVQTSPSDDAILNAVVEREKVADIRYLVEQLDKEFTEFLVTVRFYVKSKGGEYLFLHYKLGMDFTDVATAMGIDPSTERDRRYEALIEMYDKELLPVEYRIPVYQAI